ncbi:hypothetical protein, partial [Eubacterium sp.]|uniref:hypothetical protein n=1 Tax=Eubacterium sp. TaxID=142586 RepID=UPI0025F85C11
RLKKKYDYRMFDSKGKVVKKIKNRSDLISVIKEYKLFNYYFDEGIDETDFKEENFKNNLVKFNLVQNAANGTISNKDGKRALISSEYGSGTIYIVDLESGKTKEMNIKSKNSKFISIKHTVLWYAFLNLTQM